VEAQQTTSFLALNDPGATPATSSTRTSTSSVTSSSSAVTSSVTSAAEKRTSLIASRFAKLHIISQLRSLNKEKKKQFSTTTRPARAVPLVSYTMAVNR